MSPDVLFAGVPVREFPAAVEWYARLLGRPADVVAHDREVMWRIADGGWLYVLADATRSGGALVTIAVPDLDAALAEVAGRGIESPPLEKVGTAGRKATYTDPEGNRVSCIEVAR